MKHTVTLQAFLSGAWTTVSTEALTGRKIVITRGMTEQGELRPCKMTWSFLDPAGKWRPSNPVSPVYGVAGRNMPVRVTVDGSSRAYAEASSFQPEQDVGGPALVHLTAEGLQRRIGLWTERVRSPIYRQLLAQPAAVYWPLETGSGSAYAGRGPAEVLGGTFDDDNMPGGASGALTLTSLTSRVSGPVSWKLPTDGYAAMFYFRLPNTAVGSYLELASVWATQGTVRRWLLTTDGAAFNLTGLAVDGSTVVTTGPYLIVADPTRWIAVRILAKQNGANVDYALTWHQTGTDVFVGPSGSYAGVPGRPSSVFVLAPVAGTQVDHLWVGDDLLAFVDNAFAKVSGGYVGELAADRFFRLLREAGVAYSISGSGLTTQAMGPQPPGTLVELMKECVRTDDALAYDSRNAQRIVFRTRDSLLNQTPKIALAWPGDIAPTLDELIDDDGVFNRVTVKDRRGGEATASLDSGPLSTQPSPAGVGEYRQDVDVNVSTDAVLPDLAGWWLWRGTAQGLSGRYPSVTIDLDGMPGLATAASSVDIGDVITISGRDPDVVRLLVLGTVETVEEYRRTITFTCINAAAFVQAVYTTGGQRYGSATTTLSAGYSASAGSMVFTFTNLADQWSQGAVPYDVLVAGERIRVVAMGAVTGTGPWTQTATVTRAINSVSKAQIAGEPVQVHPEQLARYGH